MQFCAMAIAQLQQNTNVILWRTNEHFWEIFQSRKSRDYAYTQSRDFGIGRDRNVSNVIRHFEPCAFGLCATEKFAIRAYVVVNRAF